MVPDSSLSIRERAVAAWPTAWQGQNLRDIITTTQSNLFDFLKGTNIYDPDRLALDRELLRQHYLKNGIPYLVSGGGGAPLYDVDRPPAGITQMVVKIENFLSVSVQGKKAHIEAIAIDGKKLDELDIQAK